MNCYITSSGLYLPGERVSSHEIQDYLGVLDQEDQIKDQILHFNGIKYRHYALDKNQIPTDSVYGMGAKAVEDCLKGRDVRPSYLSAGSTFTPYSGPGIGTFLHETVSQKNILNYPLEINSNSGICTSSSMAMINAFRAIKTGSHRVALCVGSELSSEILKSTKISLPPKDFENIKSLRKSKWFMSVFLRFMLSDGAGALLLQNAPVKGADSLKINWTYSQSYAHEAPRCMSLESHTRRLSQDTSILSRYLFKYAEDVVRKGLLENRESLAEYNWILPHISSFYFHSRMEKLIEKICDIKNKKPKVWSNLQDVGNMGAASMYVLLGGFIRERLFRKGEKILLFVPESGQFNFCLMSLTVE